MITEPMFLNPVLRCKTYVVLNANEHIIGRVNDDNIHGAWRQARSLYPNMRTVHLETFVPSKPVNQNHERKTKQ